MNKHIEKCLLVHFWNCAWWSNIHGCW